MIVPQPSTSGNVAVGVADTRSGLAGVQLSSHAYETMVPVLVLASTCSSGGLNVAEVVNAAVGGAATAFTVMGTGRECVCP